MVPLAMDLHPEVDTSDRPINEIIVDVQSAEETTADESVTADET